MTKIIGNLLLAIGLASSIWAASWCFFKICYGDYGLSVYAEAAFSKTIASSWKLETILLLGVFLVVVGGKISVSNPERGEM